MPASWTLTFDTGRTIGLLSAIDEYQSKYNVKFSSFAYICIIRKIYNVIKQSNGNKHQALNEGISFTVMWVTKTDVSSWVYQ